MDTKSLIEEHSLSHPRPKAPGAPPTVPGGPFSQAHLMEQTNRRLHQLAARLEQLQASLDLWTKAPTTAPEAAPAQRQHSSGGGKFLFGVLLIVIGALAGVFYQQYSPIEWSTLLPWQQLDLSDIGDDPVAALAPAAPAPAPAVTLPVSTAQPHRESTAWNEEMFQLLDTPEEGADPAVEPASPAPAPSVPAQAARAPAPIIEVPRPSAPVVASAPAAARPSLAEAPQAPPPPVAAPEPAPHAIQPINGYLNL